jgi:hypothetical protein
MIDITHMQQYIQQPATRLSPPQAVHLTRSPNPQHPDTLNIPLSPSSPTICLSPRYSNTNLRSTSLASFHLLCGGYQPSSRVPRPHEPVAANSAFRGADKVSATHGGGAVAIELPAAAAPRGEMNAGCQTRVTGPPRPRAPRRHASLRLFRRGIRGMVALRVRLTSRL